MKYMIAELLQNPHYIIDFNSYEGLRNIAITTLLFVFILILGRNLNNQKFIDYKNYKFNCTKPDGI